MVWDSGAEFAMVETTMPACGGFSYPDYGVGYPGDTWFGCTIVDANGKEIPWVDRDGRVVKTVSERFRPVPGQKFFLLGGGVSEAEFGIESPAAYKYQYPRLIRDLPERIKKGEFVLPLYADLPAMPELERRAIFGLMVGNEGATRIPIYDLYTKAGFDPDKDLLQAPVFSPPDWYRWSHWSFGPGPPQWREMGFGSGQGLIIDWDLKTTLEGLYAAGMMGLGGADHSRSATTGRYAGRKATEYAHSAHKPVANREQVKAEKARVYAPIKRENGIQWKELHAGIARIMQDYCGEYKIESTLKLGLIRLKELRENEASTVFAMNPHELWRTFDCMDRITCGQMIMQASLARKASSKFLFFQRIDYPEMDPPEWEKFVTIRLENGEVKVGELPFNYWLLLPNAPTYEENYKAHCGL